MKTLLKGLLGFALSHSVAIAADAPPLSLKATPAAVGDPWYGPYLRAGVGYGWGQNDASASIVDSSKYSKYSYSGTPDLRTDGGIVDFGIGFFFHPATNVIFGGDASWGKTWFHGSATENNTQIVHDIKSLGRLQGIVGLLITPKDLIAVEGGAAFAQRSTTATSIGMTKTSFFNSVSGANGNSSSTDWGWTIGGMWEHMMNQQVRFRLEAYYVALPDQTTALTAVGGSSWSPKTISGSLNTSDKFGVIEASLIWRPWN